MNHDGKFSKAADGACARVIARAAHEEGYNKGYNDGLRAAQDNILDAFADACEVTKVVHKGDITVMYFADGKKEKVIYDPSYGYGYDREKAYMAALLKHVVGSSYITGLRSFEKPGGKALIFPDDKDAGKYGSCDGFVNVGREMIRKAASDDKYDFDALPAQDENDNHGPDSDFLAAFAEMPDEIAWDGCGLDTDDGSPERDNILGGFYGDAEDYSEGADSGELSYDGLAANE